MQVINQNEIENKDINYPSSYHEIEIGKTLYRVTSLYKGEFELGKALEDLIIRKILSSENTFPRTER